MSDPKMMSATGARAWLDPSAGPKPEVPSPLLVDRYARTIVAQAEQIERLQRAVNYAIIYSLQDAADLVVDGVLHPEDMEAPA